MLIGARDKKGTTNIYAFRNKSECDLKVDRNGDFYTVKGFLFAFDDDRSKNACRDISPGSWKEIDLAASTIAHVQPKKTAVEELVEAADFVITAIANIGHDDIEFTSWPVNGAKLKSLKRALARVRQEGGV